MYFAFHKKVFDSIRFSTYLKDMVAKKMLVLFREQLKAETYTSIPRLNCIIITMPLAGLTNITMVKW
ncbi:hypothetical protein FBFR_12645 [Flavobacterium fryxellicola]|uniref:Uncharacterized protein n=1 Tax=Flavobacterium fryxellicola TaxID=249352 RepID=A0A167VZK0_9FLAO|nr:hypothetical protein FBFR_12645 [Flavobacterium fryxellicola]